jgi:inosine triphosphate pyrophosphatase
VSLHFLTGNRNKFIEAKAVLGELLQLELELPEIQDIDPHNIIRHKLNAARAHHQGSFIVDDTSLCLECLNGLPGPLIKWFLETIGTKGLVNLTEALGNSRAEARCMIGYYGDNEIQFFEGIVRGRIVQSRGQRFGWDPIFQPDGFEKTFAEMAGEEKNAISHRRKALEQLKNFLCK